ncbi:MAG: phosphate ABC transporter permease PstA [Planctomycetes bacterium]|nr:phosphate ABC transporter permease PstA [Planctomycetota bacterium]
MMTTDVESPPRAEAPSDPAGTPVDRPRLEHDLRAARSVFSGGFTVLCALLSLIAAFPLFGVLYMLIERGAARLSWSTLVELPPSAIQTEGGGFGNALAGTVFMVLIAGLIAVPAGVFAAVFLAEFGKDRPLAAAIRFGAKVLTGMPSIIAGIFGYALVVLTTGSFSAYAGGVALSILMLPIVTLTAEQAIRAVPAKMKEAAVGMGATPTQVVWRVTLPTAMPSILTGVMLAVARAAGETAPLLFTAQFTYFALRVDRLENAPSLAVLIYEFSGSPYEHQIALAWSASLVLVLLVLVFNLGGQLLARRNELARTR